MYRGQFPGELDCDTDSSDSDSSVVNDGRILARVAITNRVKEKLSKNNCEPSNSGKDVTAEAASTSSPEKKDCVANQDTVSESDDSDSLKNNNLLETEFHQNLASERDKLDKKVVQLTKKRKFEEADRVNNELIKKDADCLLEDTSRAVKFLRKKQEETDKKLFRRKKPLAWGFETKKRWETKSNM